MISFSFLLLFQSSQKERLSLSDQSWALMVLSPSSGNWIYSVRCRAAFYCFKFQQLDIFPAEGDKGRRPKRDELANNFHLSLFPFFPIYNSIPRQLSLSSLHGSVELSNRRFSLQGRAASHGALGTLWLMG